MHGLETIKRLNDEAQAKHDAQHASVPQPISADFAARDEGSVWLLLPISSSARRWCMRHLPASCPRFGTWYAIETRYFGDILEGIQNDGLTVKRGG